MHSMVRYLIPIHALLFPGVAAAADGGGATANRSALRRIPAFALTGLALFALELLFLSRYVRGDWVS
jgi:hypothetical protein